MTDASPRLHASDLHLAYPGLTVLAGADITASAGEVIAVQGASGTGKSTLLHCLGLLERPNAGSIRLDGAELTTLDRVARARVRATRIGFVFQAYHLLPEFTVRENVLIAARVAELPWSAAQQRCDALLTHLGLGARGGSDVRVLSGGERQRVAIARALLPQPALLLADEPTGNLDPATAAGVLDSFLSLARDLRSAVILVTHDPAVAARADRRVFLRYGRVHAEEARTQSSA